MWNVYKYLIDDINNEFTDAPDSKKSVSVLENILQPIKDYVDKHTENYLISLHYIEFPIIISYGKKVPENEKLKILNEYIEPYKEVVKILMTDKVDFIKGFYFIRNNINMRKSILSSTDQETFDIRAANSGLESYIINDLRTIWKNNRYIYLSQSLAHKEEVLYQPDREHPLYSTFVNFLKNIYRKGIDRFKTFICIGSTFIGKSVFFTKFIVPEKYYIYHSNNLEYSKMPDQPKKIFRILDDINWLEVTCTELKALLNRNISSVNIKYGYEYIFPLIPIIVMNKEDYMIFQKHFSDIWDFIERNAVIYPPQREHECIQEEQVLFTNERVVDKYSYLFEEIMPLNLLEEDLTIQNTNEFIKNYLNKNQGYIYDTSKYLQLPDIECSKIPNPEKSKKSIMRQYEEYLLKKKVKEIENGDEDKGPRSPWYMNYGNNKYKKKTTKFDDIDNDTNEYNDDNSYQNDEEDSGEFMSVDDSDDSDNFEDDDDSNDDLIENNTNSGLIEL